MGCFGSRFDKRVEGCDNLATVGTQFTGGEGNANDKCPVDKVALAYGEKKEIADVFKAKAMACEDEDIAKKIANETHADLKAQLAWLDKEFDAADDKVLVGGKYKVAAAKDQLKAVQAALTEAGFAAAAGGEEEKKEEAKEEAKEGDMEMMMEGGDEMMEGMEMMMEGAMGMDMMMGAAADPYAGDETDYSGFANLPKLLLKQAVVNPYFGDLLKRAVITWEFNYDGTAPDKMWQGAAGLLGASIDAGEAEAKDVWFAGFVGEHDFESLKEIAEAKGEILFPGWISGWDSEEAAKKDWGDVSMGKVLFKTNAKACASVVCRHFIQRFGGTIESAENKDGVYFVTLKEVPAAAMTVADWEKAKNAPAAAAPVEGKEEEKKEEEKKEEEKKEDEAPME